MRESNFEPLYELRRESARRYNDTGHGYMYFCSRSDCLVSGYIMHKITGSEEFWAQREYNGQSLSKAAFREKQHGAA